MVCWARHHSMKREEGSGGDGIFERRGGSKSASGLATSWSSATCVYGRSASARSPSKLDALDGLSSYKTLESVCCG